MRIAQGKKPNEAEESKEIILVWPDLVNIESVQRNAVIIGSVVYHTAMRDEKLPRKLDR